MMSRMANLRSMLPGGRREARSALDSPLPAGGSAAGTSSSSNEPGQGLPLALIYILRSRCWVRARLRSSWERKSTATEGIRALDSRTFCTVGDQSVSTSPAAGRSICRLCCPCSWRSLFATFACEMLVCAKAICCHTSLLPDSPSCLRLR